MELDLEHVRYTLKRCGGDVVESIGHILLDNDAYLLIFI